MLNKDELWSNYYTMLTIRLLEDELQKLCFTGEAGDLHFNKGQEAISVGVMSRLHINDYVVTHHRTIAHAISKGVPMDELVAELLGKKTGLVGGKSGEMHIQYPKARFMFSFQLVGTCLPVATGLAWASQYYKKNDEDIVAVFMGDAVSSNAQFNEGANIASIQKVPLLIVCEDNHLAGNITPEIYLPKDPYSLYARFQSFGIPAYLVDGNKIDEVKEAAKTIVEEVRLSRKPCALICDTTRLTNHKQGQGDIRTKEAIAELAKRDPLLYLENLLDMSYVFKEGCIEEAKKNIQEAIEKARKAPWPTEL